MGVVFWLFSHFAGCVTVLLLALALSSGLYMLSMFAEEFPSAAGRYLRYLIGIVVALQLLLWLDGLPLLESIVELGTLGVYSLLMRKFPVVDIFSLPVLVSVLGFFATNILWLKHFLRMKQDSLAVLGFFVVMVWSIPCGLVASLTVEDSSLPLASQPSPQASMDNIPPTEKRKSSFRVLAERLYESLDALLGGAITRLWTSLQKRFH